MIKFSETDSKAARERVVNAATVADAAQYLYKSVGLVAIQALARAMGLRLRENSDINQKWCERLAERLHGNPVA